MGLVIRHVVTLSPSTRTLLTSLANRIARALHHLEQRMTSVDANLDALNAKVETLRGADAALVGAFTTLASDVRALLQQGASDAGPETQAKFNALGTTLDSTVAQAAEALVSIAALGSEVGDRDGDGTPVVSPPAPPAEG